MSNSIITVTILRNNHSQQYDPLFAALPACTCFYSKITQTETDCASPNQLSFTVEIRGPCYLFRKA